MERILQFIDKVRAIFEKEIFRLAETSVTFMEEFADSSLNFKMRVWIPDPMTRFSYQRSQLRHRYGV